MNRVYLELGPKKVFACSLDWPGWCRVGTSEELALEALDAYTERYRVIAERAGLRFRPGDPDVVERVTGNATTDFGAPAVPASVDSEPTPAREAKRAAALVQASWAVFADVVASSPAELHKGPRGGGRDRDKMVTHVVEAERSYARKIGVRHPPLPTSDTTADAPGKDTAGDTAGAGTRDEAIAAMRADIIELLCRPSDGALLVAKGWPVRYAARRIAWHVIDHAWEMEDRRG